VLSESPGTIRSAGSSRPGQHNTEIYADLLGLPGEEIADLESKGVL
jgi:formyl-CoA transferase